MKERHTVLMNGATWAAIARDPRHEAGWQNVDVVIDDDVETSVILHRPAPLKTPSNFQWVRTGVTRDVFLVGSLAFKLPKLTYGWKCFLQGLLANMQERQFAATGWPEFCPIRFSIPGGWLVVMSRARPLTAAELATAPIEMKPFAHGAVPWLTLDADYIIPVECKEDSFGVFEGRIVAVDYGN